MSRSAPAVAGPADGASSVSCFHCHLPISQDGRVLAPVHGRELMFCCQGCRSVCEAIYDAGLEGFYQRVLEGEALAPPPELPKELAIYDLDEVQEEFVHSLEQEREVSLLVDGIHCAACVWLIENSLRRRSGILEARVNLTGRKLQVKWANDQLQLSDILKLLGELGYSAVPFDPETAENNLKRQNRHLLYRMGFAAFAMMNLMWISIALYSGADQGEFRGMFHWIGLALATPTLIYSGQPFFKGAWNGLKQMHFGMDLPIAIGAGITYLYSVYVTVAGVEVGEVYFDTVVNFLFVILVGRYLEAISKRQALSSTQRLLDLQPRVATVLRGGAEQVVPIRSVKAGERVLVRPGDRIPVDGKVLQGRSRVDEALLTGESQAVSKQVGDRVSAGTINGHGSLELEVTGLLKDSALGRIIRLVEDAQASKAPIQCVADKIVPWFVLATLGLATVSFFWWLDSGIEQALMAATAVLIITCPCAFGLATPMSIAVASGLGAKHGILVKNGAVLETLSSIDHFVFDKTGTLTEGLMSVTSVDTARHSWQPGHDPDAAVTDLLVLLAALECRSEHPLARAVIRCADQLDLAVDLDSCRDFKNQPGLGVAGTVAGSRVLVGSAAWMRSNAVEACAALQPTIARLDRQGAGVLHMAVDGREVAVLGIEDRLRAPAAELIGQLKAQGMKVTLLSGDKRATAEAIAERLGGMAVIAEVMPADKDKVIADLQAQGLRVVMIGDGVNDAPALVRADVGVALGTGTDVSIASADIVLLSSDLDNIELAAKLSRRTLSTIRQNIGISILYNLIMVPLAMAALVTPLVAAITMPISSLLVIGNAARIRTLFRGKNR